MKLATGTAPALALGLALACGSGCNSGPEASAATEAAVAFVNVNLIPMTSDQVLPEQTVVVQGERIVAVGGASEIEVPAGARRIEGAGRYLIPGLAEMHGHVPPPNASDQYTQDVLFLYVANGITTVRGMLGASGQLELRDRASRREIVSPTLYLAGPSFNGNSISSPQEAVDKVKLQKSEGWDLLKVHPGLTRDEYDAMAGTARDVGIRFGGHVPQEVGLIHALESGQETFDHLDGYIEYLQEHPPIEAAKMVELARKTRDAGAWVVPTMALWETLLGVADLEVLQGYPELRYMPDDQVQTWTSAASQRIEAAAGQIGEQRKIAAARRTLLKTLSDEGVLILMGTDAPQIFSVPGFSLRHELAIMADSGMSPYEILVSGTRNVGKYFENADRFGTIEAGNRADLLLVNANPLEDIGNVFSRAGVMVRGTWLPESEIQARLEEIAASR